MKLYRGFKRELQTGIHENPFLQAPRTPVHTPKALHEYADEWFARNFGVRARSQTIICTTDFAQAAEYGKVFEIEPQGEKRLLIYSPSVKDFLDIWTELTSHNSEAINSWLGSKGYQSTQDTNCINVGFSGEVMVFCTTFRAQYVADRLK